MSDQYLSSKKVLKAYPTSMRATEYDPESALLTESNLTCAVRALLKSKKSFIISWDANKKIIEFVLKGYYFKADLTDVLVSSSDLGVKLQEASRELSVSVGTQSYMFDTDVMGETGPSNLDDSGQFKGFAYTTDAADQTVDLWLFKSGSLNDADVFRFDTADIQDKGTAKSIDTSLTTDAVHVDKITSKNEGNNITLGNTVVPEGSVALGSSDSEFNALHVKTANVETANVSESVTVGTASSKPPLSSATKISAGTIEVNNVLCKTTISESGVTVGGDSGTTISESGVSGTIIGLNTKLYEHNIILTSPNAKDNASYSKSHTLYLKVIDTVVNKYSTILLFDGLLQAHDWQILTGHLDVSDTSLMQSVTADQYYSIGIYCNAERVYYSSSAQAPQASFIAAWWDSTGNWPKVQQCTLNLGDWTIVDTIREIVIKKDSQDNEADQ